MTSSSSLNSLFKYWHFDRDIIILCVRWYVSYKLSYRDLVEMMAERRVALAHTTVLRWVTALYARVREALDALCSTCG